MSFISFKPFCLLGLKKKNLLTKQGVKDLKTLFRTSLIDYLCSSELGAYCVNPVPHNDTF